MEDEFAVRSQGGMGKEVDDSQNWIRAPVLVERVVRRWPVARQPLPPSVKILIRR